MPLRLPTQPAPTSRRSLSAAGISSSKWSMILSGPIPSASAWKVVTIRCRSTGLATCADVGDAGVQPAVQDGAGLGGQDQRLAGARAGAPGDALAGPARSPPARSGRLARTRSRAYWKTWSATGTRRTRCCNRHDLLGRERHRRRRASRRRSCAGGSRAPRRRVGYGTRTLNMNRSSWASGSG